MSKAKRITSAILFALMTLTATPVTAQEPTADIRAAATALARLQGPLEKWDLKGYCTAIIGSPEYVGYVTRACQHAVKVNQKQPADCSDANIKGEIKADLDRCLATPAAEFEETVQKWREGRERFVRDIKAKGLDGEKH